MDVHDDVRSPRSYEVLPVHGDRPDPESRVRGFDHPAVANVDGHVADRVIEEQQIAGLEVVPADMWDSVPLGVRGAREADPGVPPGPLHEARTVEPVMQSLAAVHVGRSDGLTSGTQDGVDLPFAGPLPQLAHAHALRPRMRRERAVLDGGRA